MKKIRFLGVAALICFFPLLPAFAKNKTPEICPRPPAGSDVSEPEDLRSQNGILKVDFKFLRSVDAQGGIRYCYIYKDGAQAPTLRLKPGDVLVMNLKNDIAVPQFSKPNAHARSPQVPASPMDMNMDDSCANGSMTALSTNLHFHGMEIPPVCHQDDVLHTAIDPSAPPYEYRFHVSADQPPGLYWYHPHLHGFTTAQVLGGASGALIVEGVERENRNLAGLPERVIVIRDQELVNPNAVPSKSTVEVPVLKDAEGDILNMNTGSGKPAKDLSVNFIPVPYPDYPPAVIAIKPGQRQLWRVLNASAITYVDLQILQNGSPLPMGVISFDGVPIDKNAMAGNRILWESHYLLPPAGRIEFIFKGPVEGTRARLVTRSVDTGPSGENDPLRPLADILSRSDAPELHSTLSATPEPALPHNSNWLGNVKPVRERKLYFSEKPSNPDNPASPTVFMLTVEGQQPTPYDPRSTAPNIIVQQGDVEDWTIENRTQELHAFHIHQTHFILEKWNGVPIDEPYLRDTVNVAYWDGHSPIFPSVRLRMDFRDPNMIGTFVYHCHLLEHEDGGMMGTIQVIPSAPGK